MVCRSLVLALTVTVAAVIVGSVSAQYGRPRPSPAAAISPKNKPTGTGGYGGSYGGIYDNPSATVEEIGDVAGGAYDSADQDDDAPVEPSPPFVPGGPVRNRAGYFRPQAGSGQSGVPAQVAALAKATSGARSYGPGRSGSRLTTARPIAAASNIFATEEEELGGDADDLPPLDESELGVFTDLDQPSATSRPPTAGSLATAFARPKSYSGGSQYGGAAAGLGKRRQNAGHYGGSVPQLISNGVVGPVRPDEAELFAEDDAANSGYGASPSYGGSGLGGGSVPSKAKKTNRLSGGYGGSVPSGYGGGASARSGGRGQGGPVTVNAAIQSTHRVEFRDHASERAPVEPITIEVQPNQNELQFRFKSASTKLNIENDHQPSGGSYSETQSEDEPHVLRHTVTRPILQEVHEVITPLRKVTQEIRPVQEEIATLVAKESGASADKAAAAGADGGAESDDGSIDDSTGPSYGATGNGNGASASESLGLGLSKPSTASKAKKQKQNGAGGFAGYGGASNGGGSGYGAGSNGSNGPKSSVSFNYGPGAGGSTSYSNGYGAAGAPKAKKPSTNGYGSNGNGRSSGFAGYGSGAGKSNGNAAGGAFSGYGSNGGNGNKHHKNGKSLGGAQSGAGGYGATVAHDSQSASAVQLDRVGNGMSYQTMSFTMGSDAMSAKAKSSSSGPTSSSRSGYPSGRQQQPWSPPNVGGPFSASTVPSVQRPIAGHGNGHKRRNGQQVTTPRPNVRALIEEELENGELSVGLFDNDGEPLSLATGGSATRVAKPPRTGYRNQLGQMKTEYRGRAKAAAAARAAA